MKHLLLALLLVSSAACAKDAAPAQSVPTFSRAMENAPAAAPPMADTQAATAGMVAAGERMVIQNGSLSLTSETPQVAAAQIERRTLASQGYVVERNDSGDNDYRSITLRVRVPADALASILEEFRGLGEVSFESMTGEDVTEEFVDLQARLKVQRALENRFIELLTSAQNVEDTIRVEQELARVRGELERMEGRTKYLRDQAAMATLTINISTKSQEMTQSEVGRAFRDAGGIIETVIAGMIRVAAALLPIALVGSLLTFGLVTLVRRRRKG